MSNQTMTIIAILRHGCAHHKSWTPLIVAFSKLPTRDTRFLVQKHYSTITIYDFEIEEKPRDMVTRENSWPCFVKEFNCLWCKNGKFEDKRREVRRSMTKLEITRQWVVTTTTLYDSEYDECCWCFYYRKRGIHSITQILRSVTPRYPFVVPRCCQYRQHHK